MKRFSKILMVSSLVFFGTLVSCGAGDNNTSEDGEIKVIKAEITSDPSKLTYKVGDMFSTAGMSVLATYSDGDTRTFRTGFKTDKTEPLTASDTQVKVTWDRDNAHVEKTYNITVEAISLKSFVMTSGVNKVSVASKSTLDLSANEFTATYNDDTTEVVTVADPRVSLSLVGSTKTIKNGVTGAELGEGDHVIRVNFFDKYVEIQVNVFNGYKIEGEYLTGEENPTGDSWVKAKTSPTSEYLSNPATNLDTGNGSICGIKEPTASNGQFLGGISAGAVIEFYFRSASTTTAHIVLRAASNWVKEMVNNFPSWTGDVVAKDMFTISCNGSAVAIPDDSILEGSGQKGGEGNRMNYRNFKDVDLGSVNVRSDQVNVVTINYKTSEELAALGITDTDTGKNKYMNSNSTTKYGVPAIDYLYVNMA